MNKIFNSLNITDLFALFIAIWIIACSYSNDNTQYVLLNSVMPMVITYVSVRLSFLVIPKMSEWFLVLLAVACLVEVFVGVSQLLGLKDSNNSLYVLTGTFKNPGPYGGFLAVCIGTLLAYLIKTAEIVRENIIVKLQRWLLNAVAVMAFIILPSTQSRSAILALGCSIILLVGREKKINAKIKPVLKKYGLWLLIGVMLLGTGAYLFKKPSADGRFFIDRICIKAICSNVWKGAGLNHFGGAYGKAQADYFEKQIVLSENAVIDWTSIDDRERMIAECPDNAFNEFLFIGVEAGIVCMLLFVGIFVYAIVYSSKQGTIWCYGLIIFFVFAFFSYPLHVMQFQVLFPALLAASISDRKGACSRRNVAITVLMTLIIMALSITRIVKTSIMNEHSEAISEWEKVERWHKLEYYDHIIEDCESLFPEMKNDYHFLFAYGQSLNKTGCYDLSDSVLLLGTEISSDPMFWVVMGNNSLEQGRYQEAEERYKHAFFMVPNRLYPLYLLSKLYFMEGDTVRFLDMADKVESFVPKVESVNTERLRNEISELKLNMLINSMKDYD